MITYTKPPERVVTIWQNSVETLLALGVGDRIIGSAGLPGPQYLLPEYREAYMAIPYRNSQVFAIETILAMKPDFILGWQSTFSDKTWRNENFWAPKGTQIFISPSSIPLRVGGYHRTLDDEYRYIEDLGKIFDRREQAAAITYEMRQEINRVISYANNKTYRESVVILEWEGRDSFLVYGEHTLAADIVKKLQGNLLRTESRSLSMEQLLELNPEVIFLVVSENQYQNMEQLKKLLYQKKALQSIRAIKNKRITVVPLYAVYSASIRSLDGIKIIAKGLYPEFISKP